MPSTDLLRHRQRCHRPRNSRNAPTMQQDLLFRELEMESVICKDSTRYEDGCGSCIKCRTRSEQIRRQGSHRVSMAFDIDANFCVPNIRLNQPHPAISLSVSHRIVTRQLADCFWQGVSNLIKQQRTLSIADIIHFLPLPLIHLLIKLSRSANRVQARSFNMCFKRNLLTNALDECKLAIGSNFKYSS